ncbi:hypothetical protein GCM10028778_06500 [Barrientosiimonas marina]|uniref:Uncharacterized protein n=1 Tax=Lentibacillus kimchii TaxID=1542911 RepID=A0ABW2UUY5_9BACI
MFNTGLIIGLSLLVVIMLVNVIITATSSASPGNSFGIYLPPTVIFAAGLIMLAASTFGKIEMAGLGFGGWGAASLFAAAVGFVVTSVVESYRQAS